MCEVVVRSTIHLLVSTNLQPTNDMSQSGLSSRGPCRIRNNWDDTFNWLLCFNTLEDDSGIITPRIDQDIIIRTIGYHYHYSGQIGMKFTYLKSVATPLYTYISQSTTTMFDA